MYLGSLGATLTTMTAAVHRPTEGLFNEKCSANNMTLSDSAQAANEKLITTIDGGPKSRKQYAKAVQTVIQEDRRPKIKFFALLNRKPYRKDDRRLDCDALCELMREYPDFCQDVYRFEAFHRELLHPLHMLAALSADLPTIRLCFKHCEAALFHDASPLGAPVHYAVTFNAAFDVVRWLVKKDIDALQLPNQADQHTPLHLAVLYEADAETCFFLTDRCAKAAQCRDSKGHTPLHLACSGEEPELEIVEDLTEVYADAGLIKSDHGKTPLMCALQAGADTPVLRDLICSCPAAAAVANRNGSTPLHLALRRACEYDVIKDLVIAAKESCTIKDKKWGNLPVHTAVASGCNDMQVYKLLARKYPDGLEEPNKAGDTPHAMALKAKGVLDEEIVEFLNPFEEVSE